MAVRMSDVAVTGGGGGASRELIVPAKMVNLSGDISSLEEAVQELEKRLSPVLKPEDTIPEPPNSEKAPPQMLPPMAIDLDDKARRVRIARAVLVRIIERLEV